MTKEEQAKLNQIDGKVNNLKDLLLVINERQRAIREEDLTGIDNHLKDLNGAVIRNTIRGVENEKGIASLWQSVGFIKWAIGGELLLLIAIIGLIIY